MLKPPRSGSHSSRGFSGSRRRRRYEVLVGRGLNKQCPTRIASGHTSGTTRRGARTRDARCDTLQERSALRRPPSHPDTRPPPPPPTPRCWHAPGPLRAMKSTFTAARGGAWCRTGDTRGARALAVEGRAVASQAGSRGRSWVGALGGRRSCVRAGVPPCAQGAQQAAARNDGQGKRDTTQHRGGRGSACAARALAGDGWPGRLQRGPVTAARSKAVLRRAGRGASTAPLRFWHLLQ